MKKQINPILSAAISRIRQFIGQYQESGSIDHRGTKGALREGYLKQFLAGFIPPAFTLKSGFVTDSQGVQISPQIDLLAFDKTSIPDFALSDFVTIVPIESVRLILLYLRLDRP
ncbi:MAG TPA: DUF6602 domain-containing protein [Gemmataceae bacterium]|jgi:hypothetical protein|nr:DUF6602 domain-containing protein [Gemmataceae bacterium]